MDPIALAQQTTDILLPALPFIYAGKGVVTDKVKDMLLEKGIEKLGSKSIDKAKALFDKIRSKKSEYVEIALEDLSKNLEDPKAQNELQQGILKLLTEDQNLAKEIESIVINLNIEKINQFTVGNHNTPINFEKCKIEGNVFENNSIYTDNSKHTHFSGNYCTYEGRKENDNILLNIFLFILEKLAPLFIDRYGKSKSMFLGLFIVILGGFVAFSSILSTDVPDFLIVQNNTGYYLEFLKLFFSYILILIGSIIFLSIFASDHTKCKMCGRGFGYKEIRRPLIEEMICSDGTRKKTTRYYKCQYCGAEKVEPTEELIPTNTR
ncbi:hypothetical protein EQO05_00935 [Methanosarcina sp. MSH10X1]|uniref:hypothetical protein n=1 Tax=Methanosarcina sp. MSH10X1 TaxID=2507075 RepID=UPI000FFBE6F3|nr:hypothetical protein [Methanosarcina sp. MSH10X1]RXA21833.1 hypothetical protein EQO05_00935 [Methanosarcina sp. MSH10X1]